MRTIKRLNEEISRWAFEITLWSNSYWNIAFTNPTAGPWKTIKAPKPGTDEYGEVYRFILEEERPDIIMYSDELKLIVIFEAKDSLSKLGETTQYKKSAEVVVKLARILKTKKTSPFWGKRADYKVILGLLWGSNDFLSNDSEKNSIYDKYRKEIFGKLEVEQNVIVTIESLYKNNEIKCYCWTKNYGKDSTIENKILSTILK